MVGFAAKYAPSYCVVVKRSLRETVPLHGTEMRFMTLWDLVCTLWIEGEG